MKVLKNLEHICTYEESLFNETKNAYSPLLRIELDDISIPNTNLYSQFLDLSINVSHLYQFEQYCHLFLYTFKFSKTSYSIFESSSGEFKYLFLNKRKKMRTKIKIRNRIKSII